MTLREEIINLSEQKPLPRRGKNLEKIEKIRKEFDEVLDNNDYSDEALNKTRRYMKYGERFSAITNNKKSRKAIKDEKGAIRAYNKHKKPKGEFIAVSEHGKKILKYKPKNEKEEATFYFNR